MARESTLTRIAAWHAFLVALVALAFAGAGLPVRGTVLGGMAMGLSFLALWAIAKAVVVKPRGRLVSLLVTLKVLFYLALVAGALTGRIVVDGGGFAAGVTCFLVAALVVTMAGLPAAQRA